MDKSGAAGKSLQQKILSEADAWLEKAGETDYTLGVCTRKDDSWYAVEVEAGQKDDYCVYVRLTPDGSEVRDDRVLAALSRELTGLCQQQLGENVLCAAWVNFCAGIPTQNWYSTDTLEKVSAEEALYADWYLVVPAERKQDLADLAAGLAVDMRQSGWVGVIHAVVLEQEQLAVLQAAQTEQSTWSKAAEKGGWIRVSPDDDRTREELAADLIAEMNQK